MNNIDIERMSDFSDMISLMAAVLSVQSTILEKQDNKKADQIATRVEIIAAFLVTVAAFIALSVAKKEYDELLKQKDVRPITLSATRDLITSRVFSCLASIYLIKSVLKNASPETAEITGGVVPV